MIRYLLFFVFPLSLYSQECTSISSVCSEYEEVEYVLVGRGDTTAVVSHENVAKDLGLKNYEETFEVDAGVCKVYLYSCLRITYMEFNDGRTGSSAISKL